MSQTEIAVTARSERGKGAARRMRAAGRVPGILYGHKEPPRAFAVDPNEFFKRLRATGFGRNTLFKVTGLDREVTALIREMQLHPVRRELVHLDFLEVTDSDQVDVEVPVKTRGRAKGMVAGGDLQVAKRSVRVKCSPLAIPKEIVLDITPLEIGQSIRVQDLPLPDGAEHVEAPRLAVVNIKESRRSRQAAAAAAAEAEGDAKKKKKK